MGYGRLYFARNPKGGIKRISASVFDRFHFRDGSFPQALADAEGMVNVAEFLVELEDRAPVRLVSVSFARYGILRDGRYDPAHREIHFKSAALKMNEAHRVARPAPPSDLIDAQGVFEGKRLDAACKWSPTDDEWDAFRKILGRRLALGDKNRGEREEAVARLPTSERVALAKESAPDWRLRRLAADTEAIVRMAVAANIYAPSEVLDVLRKDPDPGVIAALAGNHASPKWLSEIARHPSPAVRAKVAGNVRTPDHLVIRMAWADPDARVRKRAQECVDGKLAAALQQVSAPNAPSWTLKYGAQHTRVEVRLATAAHPLLPETLLPILARDSDVRVKQAIAARLGIDGDPALLFPDKAPTTRRSSSRKRRDPSST